MLGHSCRSYSVACAQPGKKAQRERDKWHTAQQKAQRVAPKAPPRAQMPGTNNGSGGGDSLESIAKSGNMEKYVAARNKGRIR